MTVTDDLITLKTQYQQSLESVSAKVDHYRAQLEHINALLLDQLLGSRNGFIPASTSQSAITATEFSATSAPELSPTPISETESKAIAKSPRIGKVDRKLSPTKPSEGRVSLPLLPAYRGMKKQEAISKLLETEAGNILTMDTIIHRLYGDLSAQNFKDERVRMKSALYQGAKQKFWQKAPQPYSYFLKPTKTKSTSAPASATSSPAAPAAEASPKASSKLSMPPIIKLPTQKAEPTKRKSKKTANVKTEPKDQKPKTQILSLQSKSLGARIILPMHEDFAGLSKIDAVLKVMKERPGKPVHIEDIMDRLFGPLSPEETRVEKGRMKDVMNRGRDRSLWTKAAVPMSFIVK